MEKKLSLSQLGPYTLARMTGVLLSSPVTRKYLPLGSVITLEQREEICESEWLLRM